MKYIFFLISLIFLITISTSCKKEKKDLVENNGIVGKWKEVERYDGYGNGGNFSWNPVSDIYAKVLTFSAGGQYAEKYYSYVSLPECNGSYVIVNSNNLEINASCNTFISKVVISELTATTLIVDIQVREGKIRHKFIAIQ